MAGLIARDAPHLDGSEDIGVWFDVAWAAYLDISIRLGQAGVQLDTITDIFEELGAETDENGQPTPEQWGASEKAQRGQASLMAMFGASPDMGMGSAPGVGDEG
jgi:hypothetical protein